MSESLKDRWFVRVRKSTGRILTQAHFCESEIADRKVTTCGREMGDIAGTDLVSSDEIQLIDLCRGGCQPKEE